MNQKHYNFQLHSIHRKRQLNISHINFYHGKSKMNNFLNGHNYPKIIYASRGNGSIFVNDTVFPLSEDDIILVNPSDFQFTLEPIDSTLELVIIGFEDIHFLFPAEDSNSCLAHYKINNPDCLDFLARILYELKQGQLDYQQACDYYINLLFIYLQREYNVTYNIVVREKSNKECELIRDYIDQHFAENITLDILAQESKMNKYYLVHSFTNNYGCSPINYLNEKKIEESKFLLETTSHSIADIAKQVGFSSQSYFSQSFKKHTYMTPNEYRRSSRKQ